MPPHQQQFQTRAQALEHLRQLHQQQQEKKTNNTNTSTSSLLLPASRWLARTVNRGCIVPLIHHHQRQQQISTSTISSDPTEDGVVVVRSDSSDGKRLANVFCLKASAAATTTITANQKTATSSNNVNASVMSTGTSSSMTTSSSAPTSSGGACVAICSIPRTSSSDFYHNKTSSSSSSSPPGEVWVGWSTGTISVLNEPANKVLCTLPSIAATCGTIVAMIPFVHHQQHCVVGGSSSFSSSVCDGSWLFGGGSSSSSSAPTGRSAVLVVTSSGTLLCLDTRSRSLLFRVPPAQTPRSSLVRAATALTDDNRALILLATEDCYVHAVELKKVVGKNHSASNSRHGTPTASQHRGRNSSYSSSSSSTGTTISHRVIQTLPLVPPGTKVELECCPLCITSSTTYLRDASPTVFVGFLTGHACFFKIICTGFDDDDDDDISSSSSSASPYLLLHNQSQGMTLAHDFGEAVVSICPIYHSGKGCITVSPRGACVWTIDQVGDEEDEDDDDKDHSSLVSPSRRHARETGHNSSRKRTVIGWKPIQRIENNFHPEECFPIAGTSLSSNEVVLLLSDGGLRRLLVANQEPEEEDDVEFTRKKTEDATIKQLNKDRTLSPIRRNSKAANEIIKSKRNEERKKKNLMKKKRTKIISVMVKRHDPTTGQEREVEEQVEVDDDDNYDDEESSENDEDDEVYSNNNEHDYFPTTSHHHQQERPTSAPRRSNTGGRPDSSSSATGALRGSPQRQFHSDQESQEVMMKKFGHGFWGSSSPEHKQRNDNNTNVFSRLSSPTKRRTASSSKNAGTNTQQNKTKSSSSSASNKTIHFDSSSSFLDRAMKVADDVKNLYLQESYHRQLIETEEDNDLGFFWHLHRSGLHGKSFIQGKEDAMKKLYSLHSEEREARMKNLVTPFFSGMATMMITQNIARRKIEDVILRERSERMKLISEEDDQFHLMKYLMLVSKYSQTSSWSSPPSRSSIRPTSPTRNTSSSTAGKNNNSGSIVEMLEKQVNRERAKNENIQREHQAMKDTVQTLQTLLQEEQQRTEMLRQEVGQIQTRKKQQNEQQQQQQNVHSESKKKSTLDDQSEIFSLKEQLLTLQQKLQRCEKQLVDERIKHETELQAVMEDVPPPQSSKNNNYYDEHNNNTNNNSRLEQLLLNTQHQHQQQLLSSPSSSSPSSRTMIDPLTRRSLEDETIRRTDAERSLEIVSKKLDKLTSVLAESEKESRDHRVRADTAEERLRVTEKELESLKSEHAEVRKRAERFEDLARKFEAEFSLRDEQFNKASRERDFLLKTSDDAIATVEEQQRTIRHLTSSSDSLRRTSRKLLALCDIAVSVGSEPPAMSSLRKFLRETMMECATLRRYDMMPATAVEKVTQLYDRTSMMQDHLFSASNPSMVVLDKSEAVDVMTRLRQALEE